MSKKIVNRISELKRPAPEFPRKFVPDNVNPSDWNHLEPLFKDLQARFLSDRTEVEKWLLDWGELSTVIGEESSRLYVVMTCATDNPEAEKAFLHFIENIDPKIKPYDNALDRKLLDCPHTAELDQEKYGVLLRAVRNQVELFRSENIPLETEVEKLSQQYQKLMGAMTVEFQGQERTMQQMGLFQEESNRALREEAWKTTTERRLKETEACEEIFDKMLKIRQQIANNAGFDNFRDYQFRRFNRFDYTPSECEAFHDSVAEWVVPLSRMSLAERGKAMNLDSVRPWDIACDRYGRPPLRPFQDTDKLAFASRDIFGKVDDQLGNWFQKMIDMGLLDLDSRKGKAPGGYQTTLNEWRLPFIFMNAVGLNRDVVTLLHEGGHAFHTFASRQQSLAGYRHAPMEFCEVASMSMELLGAPYLEEFYSKGDAARARRDHLEGIVGILPWIATVDAFQHWIYTHPNHTREERKQTWIKLMDRFGSGVDFQGYEEALHYRWHAQLHIFEYPFYYIEYGIAQLGALQVWVNYLNDPRGAVESYKQALALGGSKPLPELFDAANIKFDFSTKTIRPLMEKTQEAIKQEAKSEAH